MQFKDCKVGMRVRYTNLSSNRYLWEGTICKLFTKYEEVSILWDNGVKVSLCKSVKYLSPIDSEKPSKNTSPSGGAGVIVVGEKDNGSIISEDYAFFAKAPEGCCPCGIPRNSGQCSYHPHA